MNTSNKKMRVHFVPNLQNSEELIVYFPKFVPIDFLREYLCLYEESDNHIYALNRKREITIYVKNIDSFLDSLLSWPQEESSRKVVDHAEKDYGKYVPIYPAE